MRHLHNRRLGAEARGCHLVSTRSMLSGMCQLAGEIFGQLQNTRIGQRQHKKLSCDENLRKHAIAEMQWMWAIPIGFANCLYACQELGFREPSLWKPAPEPGCNSTPPQYFFRLGRTGVNMVLLFRMFSVIFHVYSKGFQVFRHGIVLHYPCPGTGDPRH